MASCCLKLRQTSRHLALLFTANYHVYDPLFFTVLEGTTCADWFKVYETKCCFES